MTNIDHLQKIAALEPNNHFHAKLENLHCFKSAWNILYLGLKRINDSPLNFLFAVKQLAETIDNLIIDDRHNQFARQQRIIAFVESQLTMISLGQEQCEMLNAIKHAFNHYIDQQNKIENELNDMKIIITTLDNDCGYHDRVPNSELLARIHALPHYFFHALTLWTNEKYFIDYMIDFIGALIQSIADHPKNNIVDNKNHPVNKLMDNATRLLLNTYSREYPSIERMLNLFRFGLNCATSDDAAQKIIIHLQQAIPYLNTLSIQKITKHFICEEFKTTSIYEVLTNHYQRSRLTTSTIVKTLNKKVNSLLNQLSRTNNISNEVQLEIEEWYKHFIMRFSN